MLCRMNHPTNFFFFLSFAPVLFILQPAAHDHATPLQQGALTGVEISKQNRHISQADSGFIAGPIRDLL